jgi:hypothetical protein
MPELQNLPCCGPTEVERLKELPHLYGCDFDLFRCMQCGRGWVAYWSNAGNAGGWELVSESDAEQLLSKSDDELRAWMRVWGAKFD